MFLVQEAAGPWYSRPMARTLETLANGSFTPSVVVRNWVGGEERDAEGGARFDSRSASNQADLVGSASLSSTVDVEAAC